MTPHRYDELTMTSSSHRTPGFRLLYKDGQACVIFVIELPRAGYRYDIYSAHGRREGVSLRTWEQVYAPHSTTIQVPERLATAVKNAWAHPDRDVEAKLAEIFAGGGRV